MHAGRHPRSRHAPSAGDDWVHAGDGDDIVYGGSGDDTLNGFGGADTIYGGTGDDVVYLGVMDGARDVYGTVADNGTDTLWRFEDSTDKLDLTGSGFASFADVSGRITARGTSHTEIDLGGGNTLILAEVTSDRLDASDFIF